VKQVVWIKWIDSNTSHRWLNNDDVKTLHVFEVTSVGFIIREDERELLITESSGDDDGGQQSTHHCPTAIPQIAILSRGILGEVPN